MKELLFASLVSILIAGLPTVSFAQHNNELYNNGSVLYISSGAEMHVLGDVYMIGATTSLENYGYLKADGNLIGDNLFQQRGTGIMRLQNDMVNIGETQKISGSFAIRGLGSANKGIDDGSFYILELANDQGIVWLEQNALAGNTPYVADVRFGVDMWAGANQNRIVTMNPASVVTNTTNGSEYTAVFGLMNPFANQSMGWGHGGMADNTVTLNGNTSSFDSGYIQGKLRRQIDASGDIYPFVIGLEPNIAGAQRGLQYTYLTFSPNSYDVVESYFQSGLDNSFAMPLECTNTYIDYFGGTDHGQWIFNSPVGGSGVYSMTVFPQDDNFPSRTTWLITKDNTISGTADECGPSPVGLVRSGFNGFSQFGLAAGGLYILPSELIDIWSTSFEDKIQVKWKVGSEHNLSHYELERSEDGISFDSLTTKVASGNSTIDIIYGHDDPTAERNKNYYYRYKAVDFDGTKNYSPIVQGKLLSNPENLNVFLFPNPTSDKINLSIETLKNRSLQIILVNSIGQIVDSFYRDIENGQNVLPISIEKLDPGVYTIQLFDTQTQETVISRFIKN